jgi:hypothetical protein
VSDVDDDIERASWFSRVRPNLVRRAHVLTSTPEGDAGPRGRHHAHVRRISATTRPGSRQPASISWARQREGDGGRERLPGEEGLHSGHEEPLMTFELGRPA